MQFKQGNKHGLHLSSAITNINPSGHLHELSDYNMEISKQVVQ